MGKNLFIKIIFKKFRFSKKNSKFKKKTLNRKSDCEFNTLGNLLWISMTPVSRFLDQAKNKNSITKPPLFFDHQNSKDDLRKNYFEKNFRRD